MQVRRRQFLIAAGVLLAAPLARAQTAPRRMAWFGAGRAGTPSPFLDAMRAGLRELGWEEGRNLALTPFWTEGTPEEAERLARQMLESNPEIIVVYGRDVLTVQRLKPAGPVVFGFSGNPVDAGVVQSFARPGGSFTGMSFMSLERVGKRVELLREIVPRIRRLAVLARPEHAGEHRERAASEDVARKLGLEVAYVPIQAASGLDGALQAVVQQHCDALVAFPDAVMLAHSGRIATFAEQRKIATVSGWGGFADNGFLLTFGPNLYDSYRRLAAYVDRILRGARPDQLPVELPRTVELVLNPRTARALGLTIPQSILLRADRVIE
ncbi:MAG: ABC transporter substrate-binding protein [Candidatus Rokubacteria bacterium]|nr:ABC transporter substrate-binding protein [Candidatus Rokubacteria bacterium]MBI3826571.1 ABC transporter substrate-binding protein [Candidatus Rokubacteria bacterium]